MGRQQEGSGRLTLACLRSSSANARFLQKEETRRDLQSMSSGEEWRGVGMLAG